MKRSEKGKSEKKAPETDFLIFQRHRRKFWKSQKILKGSHINIFFQLTQVRIFPWKINLFNNNIILDVD